MKGSHLQSLHTYLILGGASISGQAIIEAIIRWHTKNSQNYHIIATSARDTEVPFAHETIGEINFSQKEASQLLLERLNIKIDCLISTLARGKVGIPCEKASPQEVDEACLFSTYPVIYLMQNLGPQMLLSLSGFVWTPLFLQIYGAMLHAKFYLEEFIFKNQREQNCYVPAISRAILHVVLYFLHKNHSNKTCIQTMNCTNSKHRLLLVLKKSWRHLPVIFGAGWKKKKKKSS